MISGDGLRSYSGEDGASVFSHQREETIRSSEDKTGSSSFFLELQETLKKPSVIDALMAFLDQLCLQPTLIIWGEQDQVFPMELAHRLERSVWCFPLILNGRPMRQTNYLLLNFNPKHSAGISGIILD